MTISLKSFSTILADQLDLSAAAVYERQRALTRMGLLAVGGRGRNNGLEATPDNVAILLIAIMMTDNLSDMDGRVRELASAEYFALHGPGGCRLTKAFDFKTALAALLRSQELAANLVSIRITRTELHARLHYYTGRSSQLGNRSTAQSQFGREAAFPKNMRVEAIFKGSVFSTIARELAQKEG